MLLCLPSTLCIALCEACIEPKHVLKERDTNATIIPFKTPLNINSFVFGFAIARNLCLGNNSSSDQPTISSFSAHSFKRYKPAY